MKGNEDYNTYELTLLLSPDLSEFDLQKIIDKIKATIGSEKGELIKEHAWGKKQLAYPIGKAEFGNYHTLVFTLPPAAIDELVKGLRLSSKIIRHLIISLDKEGIMPDQLFSPEKEEAMISSTVKEKLITKRPPAKAIVKSSPARKEPIPEEKPATPPATQVDEDTRRKELDKKIDELLKEDLG